MSRKKEPHIMRRETDWTDAMLGVFLIIVSGLLFYYIIVMSFVDSYVPTSIVIMAFVTPLILLILGVILLANCRKDREYYVKGI